MSVDRPLPSFVGNSAWLEEKMEDPEGWNRVRDIGSERDRERGGGTEDEEGSLFELYYKTNIFQVL